MLERCRDNARDRTISMTNVSGNTNMSQDGRTTKSNLHTRNWPVGPISNRGYNQSVSRLVKVGGETGRDGDVRSRRSTIHRSDIYRSCI